MKNQMNSELILQNALIERSEIRVFPDSCKQDLVGFTFSYEDKFINMKRNDSTDNAEEYFHLDKFNLGCLIDYLKRIYDDMENSK